MIRNAWNWLLGGKLCCRCKIERTCHHFTDKLCTTCWVVDVIKWASRP